MGGPSFSLALAHLRRSLRLVLGAVALATVTAKTLAAEPVKPEPLPDPHIPGFTFPESEVTLTRWITGMSRSEEPATAANAFENIHRHGWGLWTALTAETAQAYDRQRLRVFETWRAPDALADTASAATAATPEVETIARPAPRRVTRLRIRDDERESDAATVPSQPLVDRVMGAVKFDPTAAEHIVRQQLLQRDTLDALLAGGATQIPPFPASALAIKPVFQFIRARDLAQGRYFALKVWPGPPATPRPFPPTQWPGAVWIDVAGGGTGRGAIDRLALADASTRTDETTYPLAQFLSYRLSAADADALNQDQPSPAASAGDLAVLVAMHVSSREIARWTWQTFWWTPSPDAPEAPSSALVAGLRPAQLTGAPRHYAMALAYSMLSPDQPYVGGENNAPAVYAYNPWIEARLGPADLPGSIAGLAPDGQPATNNHGIQSNCMSCHAQANYNPNRRATAPALTGARYVDLGAAEFVGTLQVDFLWSLARHPR